MDKKSEFNKICKDIKSIKIQGAENVAKAAFKAYNLLPKKSSIKILSGLRPTEPMLFNVLKLVDKISYNDLINRLDENQNTMNKEVFKLIKNNSVIFTHCHSSTVTKALIYSHKKGKKFEVYNTETRPLFQGRKTAKELKKAHIKVTTFIDSATEIALTKEQDKEEHTKPVNMVMTGTDAILKEKVINKVGSGMFAKIAKINKIPVYIIANSLKFSNKPLDLEQRNKKEVWNKKGIEVKNPAFESIDKSDITAIISELGTLSYNEFLRKVKLAK